MSSAARSADEKQHRRARLFAVVTAGLAVLGLLGFAVFGRPRPLLIYNASASAPIGFYRVLPVGLIRHGDLVLVRTPVSVRALADRRGYLPATVPLVKRIAALSGDTVCALHRVVSIDGLPVANQLIADHLGRPLPRWTGCLTLRPGKVFLLMEGVRYSFDSRYFGPAPARTIIGRLVPLWLR